MPKLVGTRLVPDAKVDRYLLARDHPEGGPKAEYFDRFGFNPANSNVFRQAVLFHPETNEVVATETTTYGLKSVVQCTLVTPDGRNPCVKTVWIVEPGSDVQRLVTAYPDS